MRAAPYPNEDQTDSREDRLVADPLSTETDGLWNDTARKNREIFTEIFRPIPTNLVRSWGAYDVGLTPTLIINSYAYSALTDLQTEGQDRARFT